MIRRLITLLAALMLLAFVVAGCGDDNEDGNAGSSDTAAETVPDTTTEDETVPNTDTEVETETEPESDTTTERTEIEESGGAAATPSTKEAVKRCKTAITVARQLSADTKADLEELCEKAASGDVQDVEDAAREVCETLVEESIPEGNPARETALDACRNGVQ